MKKILFVCHGNICRSPMAEFLLRDALKKAGASDKFYIASAATSREELGNPPHREVRALLGEHGISTHGKTAVQMTRADYDEYDFIFVMDSYNLRNISRICGSDTDGKIMRFLDITDSPHDIADPWYTGNFTETYNDIMFGISAFLEKFL